MTDDDKRQLLFDENLRLQHAMQSGVAADQAGGSLDGTPKHLRVGVNTAFLQNNAITSLLIKKGIITDIEYLEQLNKEIKAEITRYEQRLLERYGKVIKLG